MFIIDERTIVNGNIKALDLVKNDGKKMKVGDTVTIGETIGGITIESVTINLKTGENTNAHYTYYSREETFRY